jgi:hypothetical protein
MLVLFSEESCEDSLRVSPFKLVLLTDPLIIIVYLLCDSNDVNIKPLNAELNPTCHLLALLGAYHIHYVSSIRVKRRRIEI